MPAWIENYIAAKRSLAALEPDNATTDDEISAMLSFDEAVRKLPGGDNVADEDVATYWFQLWNGAAEGQARETPSQKPTSASACKKELTTAFQDAHDLANKISGLHAPSRNAIGSTKALKAICQLVVTRCELREADPDKTRKPHSDPVDDMALLVRFISGLLETACDNVHSLDSGKGAPTKYRSQGLTRAAADIFESITGKPATRTWREDGNTESGEFLAFLADCHKLDGGRAKPAGQLRWLKQVTSNRST